MMVAEAHAVVDPGAVMVESLDAAVADAAMARSLGSDYLTVRTELDWVKMLQKFLFRS